MHVLIRVKDIEGGSIHLFMGPTVSVPAAVTTDVV